MKLRVLGVDPGTWSCGYGVLDVEGTRVRRVEQGTIVARRGTGLPVRLGAIFDALEALIGQLDPRVLAIEDVFAGRNPRSAIRIGEGRGVAIACAARRGIEVAQYPPAEVKKAVTGNGNADKAQVQRMVQRLLALPEAAPSDEADALAVALCHVRRGAAARLVRGRGMM